MKRDSLVPGTVCRKGLAIPAIQEPGVHLALAFDVNDAAIFQCEWFAQSQPGSYGHLNPSCNAVRFHAAGSVDDVSSQVIEEFSLADDSRHRCARVDPDTHLRTLSL